MWRCLGRIACGGGEARTCAVSLGRARSLSSNPTSVAARYHHSVDGRELTDDYEVDGEVLGDGCCGEVLLARSRGSGRKCAVKRLDKPWVPFWRMRALASEVEVHLALDHPGIAWLCDVYETEDEISLVIECCEGGELYGELQRRGVFSDACAAECALQLLRTVAYLHARGIVHRDLKLENVLYGCKDRDARSLKLIDFGFAEAWDPAGPNMTASCGSAAYVSPDVIAGDGYTSKCDIWSLGVVLFMLLSGYPPFHGTESKMLEKIRTGQPDWSYKSRWKHASADAVDLVRWLLTKDPAKRPNAHEALQHSWVLRAAACSEVQPSPVARGALLSLGCYAGASRLRRAALRLMALEVAPGASGDIRAAFHALDFGGEGAICPQRLGRALRGEEVPEEAARKRLPFLSCGELDALCAALERGDHGPVHFSEFLAASLDAAAAPDHELLLTAFRRLDVDSAGTIDAAGVARALGGDSFEGQRLEELLLSADPRASGQLDFGTFARAVQAGFCPCPPAAAGHPAPEQRAEGLAAAHAGPAARAAEAAAGAPADGKALQTPRSPLAGDRSLARKMAAVPTPSRMRRRASAADRDRPAPRQEDEEEPLPVPPGSALWAHPGRQLRAPLNPDASPQGGAAPREELRTGLLQAC